MLHLIAYDISSPKRLRRIAKTCEDYGVRIEKSVFECNLNEVNFTKLWKKLNAIIDDSEDSLIAYPVCRSCLKDVQSAGVLVRPTQPVAYIF